MEKLSSKQRIRASEKLACQITAIKFASNSAAIPLCVRRGQ